MIKQSFKAKVSLEAEGTSNEIIINIEDSLYEKYNELLIKMNEVIKRNKKLVKK